MMSYKNACVIDKDQCYRDFVLVKIEQDRETVMYYDLQAGESLVCAEPPVLRPHAGAAGFIRPRWDGEKWTEAASTAELAAWEAENPDPDAKTLEELKATKLAALSAACGAAITAGCDVALSFGSGHISLTAEDQINLSTAMTAVDQGAEGYPYHLDGQLCAIFLAADIQAMAQAATAHKLEHTTYYNHLAAWVRRCETPGELEAITYGTPLPEDLEANMAGILAAAAGGGTADV